MRSTHPLVYNTLFLFKLVREGKITPRKVWNYLKGRFHYWRKDLTLSSHPSVIVFDITNHCGLKCSICRTDQATIVDYSGKNLHIPLGRMSLATYQKVVDDAKGYMLLSLMYLSGEPLMNNEVYGMVDHANTQKVPTLLSTSGVPLTEKAGQRLIDAGLDFLKIAVTGFTQEVYGIEHKGGDIELVKKNIQRMVAMKKAAGSRMLILVDYIIYKHNEHELDTFKAFCEDLGIPMNLRAGRVNDLEGLLPSQERKIEPESSLCDWLWTVMTVEWDGRVFPCCEYGFWGDPYLFGEAGGEASVLEVWNSPDAQKYRSVHVNQGREGYDRCRGCHYKGIRFQG